MTLAQFRGSHRARRFILPVLVTAALAACESEPPPTVGVGEESIDLGALPNAFRTPQAMIQAMATGQLYERPQRCEGFRARDSDSGIETESWTRLARIADSRAGKSPAAVLTQAVAFDQGAGTIAFISTPVGSEGAPFRSTWTLRAADGGARIDCVEAVIIANAS